MDQLVKNVPARWVENLPNPRIGPRSPTLQADSPGEGKGYPLQCSGLENPMDCIVHGVAESDTTERLSLSVFLNFLQKA